MAGAKVRFYTVKAGQVYKYKPKRPHRSNRPGFIDPSTRDGSLDGMLIKVLKVSKEWAIGVFIGKHKMLKILNLDNQRIISFHVDQLIPVMGNQIIRIATRALNKPGTLVR